MGTTAEKLNKLQVTKDAIKQSIINKGISVSDTDTFASYPSKIDSIETGSSEFFDLENWANDILDNSLLSGELLIIRIIVATDTTPITENLTTFYTNEEDQFIFSDAPSTIVTGKHTHYWDTTKDIQQGNKKYRWIISKPSTRPVVLTASNFYTVCLVVRTNGISDPKAVVLSDLFTKDMRFLETLDMGGLSMDDNTYFYLRETYSLNTIKNFHYYDTSNSQSSNNVTLVNVLLAPNAVISKNLDIRNAKFISIASLLDIINHLATVNPTQYFEMGSVNLGKLSDAQKAIATSKNWTLS